MNAAWPSSAAAADETAAAELERRVQAITQLEGIVAGWESGPASTVQALKSAIEDLNKEALRRLIRALKDDAAAGARLREALADPLVYAVLRFHGLVKEPLRERVERALDEVRPFMAEHGGNVELVALRPPHTVELRLIGSCHGCPASGQTLTEGVEKAIRAHCPEISDIVQVSRGAPESGAAASGASGEQVVHFISPFARHAASGWVDVAGIDEIPQGGIAERRVGQRSVLLSRHGGGVSCFDNSCAHLGMPLDMADVDGGVITCAYHGFRYLLETGECLTAPEVQLKVHAVRVAGERVQVRLEG
jgi:nitrite reductase/ring-hydroxylating ferredoxin subunit/Fe-S cluster biogenesis protein NfuA